MYRDMNNLVVNKGKEENKLNMIIKAQHDIKSELCSCMTLFNYLEEKF